MSQIVLQDFRNTKKSSSFNLPKKLDCRVFLSVLTIVQIIHRSFDFFHIVFNVVVMMVLLLLLLLLLLWFDGLREHGLVFLRWSLDVNVDKFALDWIRIFSRILFPAKFCESFAQRRTSEASTVLDLKKVGTFYTWLQFIVSRETV
jgi:hypothetical protein